MSLIAVTLVISSCQSNSKTLGPLAPREFTSYKLFEEPSSTQYNEFKFYFMAAAYGSAEDTRILSIRLETDNNLYAYYKTIDRNLMPPIRSAGFKVDTFPFVYTTTYFKVSPSDIDTLKMLLSNYKILELKDTVQSKHFGGRSREIVLFDNGKFYNILRDFGSVSSIEKEYLQFFDTLLKKFTPPPPLPTFRR
ncbi:MAG TPA: hypothetical protein VD993_04140 [Chitinophagaceae bacterium]|nr:hypothetical protein [Chitinophagaceae bacterium]